jgi:O-antigen ligase
MKLSRAATEDALLIVLLVFAPFAFASVHTWSWCVIAILSLVIFDIHFLSNPSLRGAEASNPSLRGAEATHPSLRGAEGDEAISILKVLKLPTSIAILAFLAVCLLYIVPLPESIVSRLSPRASGLRATYMFSAPTWQTLSIYPRATISYLIKLTSYIMVYFVVVSKIKYIRHCEEPNLHIRHCEEPNLHIRHCEEPEATKQSKNKYPIRQEPIPRSIHPAFIMFGAICGVLSILFHAFVDFNMQIPADALYFTVLLAIITGISGSNSKTKNQYPIINYRFLNKLVSSIVIIGFSVALFGIIQNFSWNGKMFWLVAKPGSNFGPFVCYNNFAGFMEMTSFMAIALFYSGIFTSPLRYMRRFKDKVVWFSSEAANKTILYLFISIVMAGALFICLSRGGIISFALAFMVFTFVCVVIGPRSRKTKLFILALIVLGLFVAMIIWLGPEATIARFKNLRLIWEAIKAKQESYIVLRILMWIDTIKLIGDFPLVGAGFGAYSNIFVLYRDFPVGWGFLVYAHQDYLHLLAETGAVGASFLVLFLVWYFRRFAECVRRLRVGARHLEE